MTERTKEVRSYLVGLTISVVLTAMAFAAVAVHVWPRPAVLGLLALLGIIQAAVQARYFLHIDLSRQKREDLQLILFTVLIVAVLVGGTIWIMASLATRMH